MPSFRQSDPPKTYAGCTLTRKPCKKLLPGYSKHTFKILQTRISHNFCSREKVFNTSTKERDSPSQSRSCALGLRSQLPVTRANAWVCGLNLYTERQKAQSPCIANPRSLFLSKTSGVCFVKLQKEA